MSKPFTVYMPYLWVLLFGSLMSACSSQKSSFSYTSPVYVYDYESQMLHPGSFVFHDSDDSSTLFVRFAANELLYTRASAQSPFECSAILKCLIYKGTTLVDSLRTNITDQTTGDVGYALQKAWKLALPEGNYTFQLQLFDEKRDSKVAWKIDVSKSTTFSRENYLVSASPDFSQLIYTHSAAKGSVLYVKSPRNKNQAMHITFEDEIKLPPPPFATHSPELPKISPDNGQVLYASEEGTYTLTMSQSIHFVTHDPALQEGVALSLKPESYPFVQSNQQLIYPLRFITSRTEFDEIQKSSFSKKLIDNFWIECGGSKQRGKELISSYYGRVEEANRYFATYTEGWRTDRGMILLIFGQPARVNKAADMETWTYSDANGASRLTFVFNKIAHPFSDNVFVLNRDPFLKPYWEQMVTMWRQGKIYSD